MIPLMIWDPFKERKTSLQRVFLEKGLDYFLSCRDPKKNNHQQHCTNRRSVERKQSCCMVYILPYIVPETHPSSRPLPLSNTLLSSLFIFRPWITVIYSPVSFSWVITGIEGGVEGDSVLKASVITLPSSYYFIQQRSITLVCQLCTRMACRLAAWFCWEVIRGVLLGMATVFAASTGNCRHWLCRPHQPPVWFSRTISNSPYVGVQHGNGACKVVSRLSMNLSACCERL